MDTCRQRITNNGITLPSIIIQPSISLGAAVVVHGYGGCKEEQLGLAWRIAEMGLTTCAIDLCGHGQNPLPFDEGILREVNSAIQYCRCFGRVVAIGHSLGGRAALLSDADYVIGLSPHLSSDFGRQTQEALNNLRRYKVRESERADSFAVIRGLPVWQPQQERPTLIVYGSRDIPEIVTSCSELDGQGIFVVRVEKALHNDIYVHELTIKTIASQLQPWFG